MPNVACLVVLLSSGHELHKSRRSTVPIESINKTLQANDGLNRRACCGNGELEECWGISRITLQAENQNFQSSLDVQTNLVSQRIPRHTTRLI